MYIMLLYLRWIAVIIFICLPSLANTATSLDRQKQALDIIADFADRFCKDIPLEGSGDNVELSGNAKTELSGVVKKLAKLGISGAGKYQNSDYQGLLQKDIIEGLKSNVDCRLKIWEDLKSTLLTVELEVPPNKPVVKLSVKEQDKKIVLKNTNLSVKNTDRYIKKFKL